MKTISKKITNITKGLMSAYYEAYAAAIKTDLKADYEAAEAIHHQVLKSISERTKCKIV